MSIINWVLLILGVNCMIAVITLFVETRRQVQEVVMLTRDVNDRLEKLRRNNDELIRITTDLRFDLDMHEVSSTEFYDDDENEEYYETMFDDEETSDD